MPCSPSTSSEATKPISSITPILLPLHLHHCPPRLIRLCHLTIRDSSWKKEKNLSVTDLVVWNRTLEAVPAHTEVEGCLPLNEPTHYDHSHQLCILTMHCLSTEPPLTDDRFLWLTTAHSYHWPDRVVSDVRISGLDPSIGRIGPRPRPRRSQPPTLPHTKRHAAGQASSLSRKDLIQCTKSRKPPAGQGSD